jgi:putative addiction module component (TIGR02574 family)
MCDNFESDQPPLTEAQKAELERRLESLDSDRGSAVTWEAVKAEMERRCP